MVATKENDVLRYVHQDHLTGTSLMTDSTGAQIGETMKYLPFGETLSGSLPTDKLFTGQRIDGTGLYYYGARYYDPIMGRFTSPDIIMQSMANPQMLNRYSYTLNNPLKYFDPSGNIVEICGTNVNDIYQSAEQGNYMQLCVYMDEPLVQAYVAISAIDDTVTSYLEASDMTIKIFDEDLGITAAKYDDSGKLTEVSVHPAETVLADSSTIHMKFNTNSLLSRSFETDTMNMAHEMVHAVGYTINRLGTVTGSMFEENLGDLYSSYICDKASIPYPKTLGDAWTGWLTNPRPGLPVLPNNQGVVNKISATYTLDLFKFFADVVY